MTLTARRSNFPLTDALVRSVAETLTAEQCRFLLLHMRPDVWKWCWLWGSSILRAYCEGGAVATISAAQFDELIRLKFLRRVGFGAQITDLGRRACA